MALERPGENHGNRVFRVGAVICCSPKGPLASRIAAARFNALFCAANRRVFGPLLQYYISLLSLSVTRNQSIAPPPPPPKQYCVWSPENWTWPCYNINGFLEGSI